MVEVSVIGSGGRVVEDSVGASAVVAEELTGASDPSLVHAAVRSAAAIASETVRRVVIGVPLSVAHVGCGRGATASQILPRSTIGCLRHGAVVVIPRISARWAHSNRLHPAP